MVTKKTYLETVDMTPAWQEVLPMLLEWVCSGTTNQQQLARDELMRMARCADSGNALARAAREAEDRLPRVVPVK